MGLEIKKRKNLIIMCFVVLALIFVATSCGEKEDNDCEHDYVWTTEREATCTEKGTEKGICSICNDETFKDIAKVGHDYNDENTCNSCGHTLEFTTGLQYEEVGGSYYVSGIGTSQETNIVIPATHAGKNVIGISEKAFYGNDYIESVYIPDGVKKIEASAFEYCICLKSVQMPDSITTIENNAFSNCAKLESVILSETETLVKIGKNAFLNTEFSNNKDNYIDGILYVGNCLIKAIDGYDKEKLVIKDGTVTIAPNALENSINLKTVEIPETLQYIGDSAFRNCQSLASITVPKTVEEIGSYVFYDCTSLEEINISYRLHYKPESSVNSVGNDVFTNCPIKKATIPSSLLAAINPLGVEYLEVTSYQYISTLGSGIEYLPEFVNLKFLDSYLERKGALKGLNKLEELHIKTQRWSGDDYYFPSILYSVFGTEEFENSKVIEAGDEKYYVPQSLNTIKIITDGKIGDYFFKGFDFIENIEIDESVDEIESLAFYGYTGTITMDKEMLNKIVEDAKLEEANPTFTLNFVGTLEEYCSLNFKRYFQMCRKHLIIDGKKADSLTLPSNISRFAFVNCETIKNVTIAEGVTSIGGAAFYGCTSLTSIEIPNSITSIGYSAFYGCSSLTDITISNSVTSIENYTFRGCSSLTDITIPKSVTSIGNSAFYSCDSLTSITIPNSVTSIGEYAFSDCTSLTSITIPDSVTSIGNSTFSNCDSLVYNEYDNAYYLGNKENPYVVLIEAKDASITSCTINENTKIICYSAFRDRTSLTSVTIPNSVTSIGDSAFSGCTLLTSVTIPNSVTSIGDSAFSGCTSLTSVTIGNSVTSVGDEAFSQCKALTEINFNATAMNNLYSLYSRNDVFSCAGQNGEGIKVTISKNVTRIPAYLFCPDSNTYSGSPKITSVEFEEGSVCESIGFRAFSSCKSLTSVTIPNSVTSIESYAFSGCTSLTEINFNAIAMNDLDRDNDVFSYAGKNGEGIKVNIGKSVTKIPAYLFHPYYYPFSSSSYSPKITSVEFEKESICKSIGDYAFYCCTSLTSIEIPNSVTSIGEYAFYDCTSLTGLEIPNSVTSIGKYAFYACTSLTIITVDENNTTYKSIDGVLYSKDGTTLVYYPVAKKDTNFTIPSSVNTIEVGAFYSCDSLTSVTIPNSVTFIGEDAFRGCNSLTSVTIPDSVTSIGEYAFSFCDSLTIYCEAESQPNGWHYKWGSYSGSVYWYSENEPTTDGNYWHYGENGEIVVWEYTEE